MMGRAGSASAFVAACGLAATFFVSAPMPAMAQTVDAAALTECLIANTTDDHIAAMKKLMIAALSDDIEGLKAEATNYGNIIVQLAIANCNIAASQLSDPAVSEAVGKYGEKLGEKIMTDAFAKISN
jgi:hypothetical protein